MSERIPPRPREQLKPEQQEFYDHFIETVTRTAPHPGAAGRASKTLFPVLAVLPKSGRHSVDLLADLEKESREFLPKDAAETVSLVTTSYFKAEFVTRVHKMMDVKLGLLTQEQADAISACKKPTDLNDKCSLAYDAAWHMLDVRGPLPQDLWERCVATFKMEALGLNMANVPLPSGPPPS